MTCHWKVQQHSVIYWAYMGYMVLNCNGGWIFHQSNHLQKAEAFFQNCAIHLCFIELQTHQGQWLEPPSNASHRRKGWWHPDRYRCRALALEHPQFRSPFQATLWHLWASHWKLCTVAFIGLFRVVESLIVQQTQYSRDDCTAHQNTNDRKVTIIYPLAPQSHLWCQHKVPRLIKQNSISKRNRIYTNIH